SGRRCHARRFSAGCRREQDHGDQDHPRAHRLRPRRGESGRERGMSKQDSARARTPIPERVDVAIVGCGLGGLTAAAHLARAGMRVALFDGHYVAGGCATQFSRGPRSARYHFDIGLHYIGDCGPDGEIPCILEACGASVEYAALDPDGFDTLLFPDLKFRIPASLELYRERLLDAFPKEKRGIDKYVKLVESMMRALRTMDRRDGRLNFFSALRIARDAFRMRGLERKTIGEVLDG